MGSAFSSETNCKQRPVSALLFLLIFLLVNANLPTQSAHRAKSHEQSMLAANEQVYVRLNQLGFAPLDPKTAVALSRTPLPDSFQVVNAATNEVVFTGRTVSIPGTWGQFDHHAELNFTALQKEGIYFTQPGTGSGVGSKPLTSHSRSTPIAGESRRVQAVEAPPIPVASSPQFMISSKVYTDVPDQLLEFMRQQRCGYNPFVDEACHTFDGRTAYGPRPPAHISMLLAAGMTREIS
jgi:endoglucanase